MRHAVIRATKDVVLSGHGWKDLLAPLYTNAAYLVANSVITGGLGLLFWIVAARLYAAQDVGLASAAISVALLLSLMSRLGLEFGIIRFLAASGSRASVLINSCFTWSGLCATALAILFLLGLPIWSPALAFLRETPLFALAFIVFVVTGSIFNLLTQTFVALRRAEFVLIQGIVLGLLRIAILFMLVALSTAFSILAAWGLTLAVTLGLGLLVFLPRLQRDYRPVPTMQLGGNAEILRFSFANYVNSGLWRAPTLLLPVMVSNFLGGEANAYFYVSWAMVGHIFSIPLNTSQSLFSEGSRQESALAQDFRRGLRFVGMLLIPAVLVMLLAGDKLLLLFGRDYSSEGTKLVWLLTLAALPLSVNALYMGVARVKKELKYLLLVGAMVFTGTIALSYALMPAVGILGPGIAWLTTQCLVTVAIFPRVVKVIRGQ